MRTLLMGLLLGNAMVSAMTDAEKKEDGTSLHGGMDEHSLILYLKEGRLARLSRIASPGHRRARREGLEGVLRSSQRSDAEDSRWRRPGGDPAIRGHPRTESDLPEGMDRAGQRARRSARREAARMAAKEAAVASR